MPTDFYVNISGPAVDARVLDLSSADVTFAAGKLPSAVMVGAAGDLKVDTFGGRTEVIPVAAGAVVPLVVTKVYKVGTTATGLTALFHMSIGTG